MTDRPVSDPTTVPRRPAAVALVVLVIALGVLVAVITPWHPVPRAPGGAVPVDIHRDFTPAEISREVAYHRWLWSAVLGGTAATLVVTLLLGFTRAGARVAEFVARPFGGRRWAQLVLGTVAITAAGQLALLPFDMWREHLMRGQGIVIESWSVYATDFATSYAFGLVGTLIGLAVFYALARRVRQWWALGAVLAAGAVAVISFAYPIVVAPAFNHFRPMPTGALRDSLLALAKSDHVAVSGVEIADQSTKSTAINAYVAGIGSSRRIVVYDTTLRLLTPAQVRSIVAHELGHAKRNDVAWGTAEAALGAGAAMCALFLLLRSRRVRRRAGITDAGDPRSLALVLAVLAALGALSTPAELYLTRRIEARADIHALELTRDPATLISLQQLISVNNDADLDPPWPEVWFHGDHPTGPQRIANARTWAKAHGVPDTAPAGAGSAGTASTDPTPGPS
ncbi:MAG TPA: M48 family metalloprotease [Sporichthyaceae bacterium]|nr:M48 family metalloprotease [Sporichthyaceae bacterium]